MIAKGILVANVMRLGSASKGRRTLKRWPLLAMLIFCVVAFAPRLAAQSAKLADDPPPPYDASDPSADAQPPAADPAANSTPANAPAAPAKPIDTSAGPAPPPAPVFDPLHSERSLDVGNFYLKKGEYDAAIDRFEEAARDNPKSAKPYLLLGETYEKKNDPSSAITAYRKYLDLFQKAPDRDRILRRIEKLQGKPDRG
jgi:tetratricopeptide (TPR) repeat protein